MSAKEVGFRRPLSDANAAASFKCLFAVSTEYESIHDTLERALRRFGAMRLRVLDVGAGFGSLTAAPCLQGGRVAKYCAVEANCYMHEELAASGFRLAGADFTLVAGHFSPSLELAKDFDVIVFSHSLYGMPNPAVALKLAAELISAGGVCIIAHRRSKANKFMAEVKSVMTVEDETVVSCTITLPEDANVADGVLAAYLGTNVRDLAPPERAQIRASVAPHGILDVTQVIITAVPTASAQ